jgi:hypothetical protein
MLWPFLLNGRTVHWPAQPLSTTAVFAQLEKVLGVQEDRGDHMNEGALQDRDDRKKKSILFGPHD